MKKVTSKLNGKTYFKTVANFSANANRNYAFIEGENYFVRKVEDTDNVDKEKFVIIKGNFFSNSDNWETLITKDFVKFMNGYNGTYVIDLPIEKETAKLVLSYID